jgi:hypothetical protein
LLLAVALLAGCGLLNRNAAPPTPPPDASQQIQALASVCHGGKDPGAPNYAKHDDHRAVVYEGKGEQRAMGVNRLPKDWTAEFPYTELHDVDVVVCGERRAAKYVRMCDDSGGQKNAIKWHTATYSFTARSARTGKPLGKPKTIKARSKTCPTNVSVGADYIPLDQFALISKTDLQDFVKPYLDR